ncbi:MAG: heme exporter protein CcmB [Thermoanaerobaculia bacterium]
MLAARPTAVLLGKDLRLEWRARARLAAVGVFGLLALVVFSIAVGPDTKALAAGAAGFLVIALLLCSTLALGESFRLENERRALEGLLLLPVRAGALFYSKAIANTLTLTALAPGLSLFGFVLFGVEIRAAGIGSFLGIWCLAAAGLAAPGTLYAAMTSRLRGRDVLLPLLLFPLVVPVLIAACKALSLVLTGDPMAQLRSWTLMLLCFDLIYWSLGGILLPYVLEEG